MSVGFALLRRALTDQIPPSRVFENGLDDSFFEDKEREAFNFIVNHYTTYGVVPQLETVGVECSCLEDLQSSGTDEPLEFWIDKVRERKQYNELVGSFSRINQSLGRGKVEEVIDMLGDVYLRMRYNYSNTRMVSLEDAQQEVVNIHNVRQHEASTTGIPYGFAYVDHISGGAQPGDVVAIAGRPGVGKSYISMKMADSASNAGYNVLYLSLEMPIVQVARRFLALQANLDGSALKSGRVSYFGIERAMERVNNRRAEEGMGAINLLAGDLHTRIEDVVLSTREQRPDILIVDGAYLLRMQNDTRLSRWDRVSSVFEQLKVLAVSSRIPIITTVQFNRTSPGTMEGIAYSDAIVQLASVIFSLAYEKPEDKDSTLPRQYRLLKLIKGRDGETGTVRILYDMHRTRIEQDRVLIGYDDDIDREDSAQEVEHDPTLFETI